MERSEEGNNLLAMFFMARKEPLWVLARLKAGQEGTRKIPSIVPTYNRKAKKKGICVGAIFCWHMNTRYKSMWHDGKKWIEWAIYYPIWSNNLPFCGEPAAIAFLWRKPALHYHRSRDSKANRKPYWYKPCRWCHRRCFDDNIVSQISPITSARRK